MSLGQKDRKLLWGRAGGLCAICRTPITGDPTRLDAAAVLGEECHIVAQSRGGPRSGQLGAGVNGDSYDNVVLLCGSDHKRVDDQPDHYTSDLLRQIKLDHEKWVAQRLVEHRMPQWRIVDDSNKAGQLELIETGRQLWNLVADTMASDVNYPDSGDAAQAKVIADLLSHMEDWIDIRDALNLGDVVRVQTELTEHIEHARTQGLALYVGVRMQEIDVDGQRSPWPLAVIRFFRADDPALRPGG